MKISCATKKKRSDATASQRPRINLQGRKLELRVTNLCSRDWQSGIASDIDAIGDTATDSKQQLPRAAAMSYLLG
jgi:hypothetical protein